MELQRFHSAKSAAVFAGCDPATIRRQCAPSAVVHSSAGGEFLVYSEAEIGSFMAWTARHGRGNKHRSRGKSA